MRRLKARRQMGVPVGSSNAKSVEENQPVLATATKTLAGQQRLLTLAQGTNIDGRNERLQQSVDFRGVKICFHVALNAVTARQTDKFFFNWAIISPKQGPASQVALLNDEFFRGVGNANRAQDFSTTMTGLEMRCCPINTDKYIIHRHKRMIMGPYESTEGKAEKYFEEWLPVKRKIVYNQTGTTTELTYPEGKDMWMVYWGSYMDEGNGAVIANAYQCTYRVIKFFREPNGA